MQATAWHGRPRHFTGSRHKESGTAHRDAEKQIHITDMNWFLVLLPTLCPSFFGENMCIRLSQAQEHRANKHLSIRGGLEMLFADQRIHKLHIPAHDQTGKAVTIAYLIEHLCENVMKDSRKELFVLDDHMYVLFTAFSCSPHLRASRHSRANSMATLAP